MGDNVLLTTIDNPYNPFTHWDDWYAYDEQHHYHTCAYLARIAMSSPELSESIEQKIIIAAMKEIVSFNLSGKHIIVNEESFESDLSDGIKRLSVSD